MIDKKYKEFAEITFDLQEYLISVVTKEYYVMAKHNAWLMLMGLMETSDIITDDR